MEGFPLHTVKPMCSLSKYMCPSLIGLRIPEGKGWINSKVICLPTNRLYAERILLKFQYKKVDEAVYKKIYLIWINQYYLTGYSVLMHNLRKHFKAPSIFLVFKFITNSVLNEVLHNLSWIFTNEYPSFPIPQRIQNNNRFEMPKFSG